MSRIWLALAILFCGSAKGAAPSYSAAGIVSTGSFAPGPFAPNSLVTIFGTGLARSTQSVTAADLLGGNALPTELNSTRVSIDESPVPLLYVSDGQVNLLIPPKQALGGAKIRVLREGLVGPEVTIQVAAAAPALFLNAGYAIATHADNSLIAPEKPAQGGELIVIYAAGLGKAETMPNGGSLLPYPSSLVNRSAFKVMLNGTAIDPDRVLYAGITPASAGLYQVNVVLPPVVDSDPELRLFVGDAGSPAGVKLALR